MDRHDISQVLISWLVGVRERLHFSPGLLLWSCFVSFALTIAGFYHAHEGAPSSYIPGFVTWDENAKSIS